MAGKNRPSFWGLYITTFVFWIGISHAGTLISAILRVVQAEWRRPITRCAEAITTFALCTGSLFPIIHLGRAWLFYWMIPYPNSRHLWPNFQSPLMWDFIAINTYLTGSVTYLYLPMIPDMAVARDKATGWRKKMYRIAGARLARHRAGVDAAGKGHRHHGAHHHSRRRLRAHDRVVGLRHDDHADVAQHDLRAVLRRRRHLLGHRGAADRDGDDPEVLPSGALPAADPFRQPRRRCS